MRGRGAGESTDNGGPGCTVHVHSSQNKPLVENGPSVDPGTMPRWTYWCWKHFCHFLFLAQHGLASLHLKSHKGLLMDSLETYSGFSQEQGIWFTNWGCANILATKWSLITWYIPQGVPFTKKGHNHQTLGFQSVLSPPTKDLTAAPSNKALQWTPATPQPGGAPQGDTAPCFSWEQGHETIPPIPQSA